ncbi:MAG: Fic/DOC family protein, partial [Acidimicrobiales bacterium]
MPIDPYLIPGTEVLRNLLGITTEAELYRVEGSVTTARINQLEQGTVRLRGRWDIAHLQAVHRHIFQDVYDWAGKLRTIAMSKGPDLHPLPRMAYGLAIFERLAQDSQLRGLETEAFVAKLSQVQSELFAWHPFRE